MLIRGAAFSNGLTVLINKIQGKANAGDFDLRHVLTENDFFVLCFSSSLFFLLLFLVLFFAVLGFFLLCAFFAFLRFRFFSFSCNLSLFCSGSFCRRVNNLCGIRRLCRILRLSSRLLDVCRRLCGCFRFCGSRGFRFSGCSHFLRRFRRLAVLGQNIDLSCIAGRGGQNSRQQDA